MKPSLRNGGNSGNKFINVKINITLNNERKSGGIIGRIFSE
jgi:hypothetical protein